MVEEEPSPVELMTRAGESLKEASAPTTLLTTKSTTRIGTWNIRTLNETGKTAQVCREMHRFSLKILGLCETRWNGTGRTRLGSGDTIIYSGQEEDQPHTHGVALLMTPEATRAHIPRLSVILRCKKSLLKNLSSQLLLSFWTPSRGLLDWVCVFICVWTEWGYMRVCMFWNIVSSCAWMLISFRMIIKWPCFNALSFTSDRLSQNDFNAMYLLMLLFKIVKSYIFIRQAVCRLLL